MPNHHSRIAVLALLALTGSSASAQLLQIGPGGTGLVITNSSGALRVDAAHIEDGARVAEFAFTLYGSPANTYMVTLPNSPAGSTVGLDFLALSGGSVSPTGNPLQFTFNPTGPIMNFRVLVQSVNPYVNGGIFPEITFSSNLPGTTSTRLNTPLVLNPNAVATPIVLQSVQYPTPISLFSGGSLSGGDGAVVNAPVTSAPGSTINATGGSLTLGNGTSQIVLGGSVNVAPSANLILNSSHLAAMLTGAISVNHGIITVNNVASPGTSGQLNFGSSASQSASATIAQYLASNPQVQSTISAGQLQTTIAVLNALNEQRQAQSALISQLQQLQQTVEVQQQLAQARHEEGKMQAQMATLVGVTQIISGATSLAMGSIYNSNGALAGLQSSTVANIRSTLIADVTITAATMNIGGPGEIDHTDVFGNFSVLGGGILAMELAGRGTGIFDTMTITGSALFDAASMLQLDLLAPDAQYSPGFLETFDLLTASSITLNGLVIATNDPSGTVFSPSVIDNADGSQTLRITAVPTPATAALLGAATLIAARRRRVPPRTAG